MQRRDAIDYSRKAYWKAATRPGRRTNEQGGKERKRLGEEEEKGSASVSVNKGSTVYFEFPNKVIALYIPYRHCS
jgi:hypothetical protein